ncbi:hypothetical protein ACFU53_21085 [Streptomyces sp. NPDC057474]|uniref:hypothetical protein n=1 Tax=Streptomyces sp. NPDC057474 TaxID=3346144 RepID=UPI0036ACA1DF
MVRIPEEDATIIKRECGADTLAELTTWAREAGAGELSLPRPLWSVPGKGYTGAVLLAAEVAPPARVVVVKVLPKGPSGREPAALGRAWDAVPDFSRRHLVGQPDDPRDLPDGRTVMFQEPAGHSLRGSRPASALDDEALNQVLGKVVGGLLTEWNGPALEREHGTVPRPVRVSDFLRADLDDAWTSGGTIQTWGRDLHLLDPSPPWIYSDGLPLPNPYLMVFGGHPGLPDPEVRILPGRNHGDLHLDNILVPSREGEPRPDEYRLIDVCTFSESSALGIDIATLLLASLVPYVKEPLPPEQRHALLRFLVDPSVTHRANIVPGAVERVTAVRDTALRIMRERHWGDQWETQFLACLQARALLFTSYSAIPEAGRAWFARLAAHAGGELLKRTAASTGPDAAFRQPERDSFADPVFAAPSTAAPATFVPDQAPRRQLWTTPTGVRDPEAVVGFGPDHTVVVVDGRGGVKRWTVSGSELPGAGGKARGLRLGHQALASSLTHSVVVARPDELDILRFPQEGGVERVAPVRLAADHFLITSGGDVLATHDRKQLTVRGFEDGAPIASVPCPSGLAASAISTDGSVIALATSRSVQIHRRGGTVLKKETENSLPYLRLPWFKAVLPDPGCWLAVSPSGSHVGCVTFEEVVVWSVADGREVYRSPLGNRQSFEGLGAAQMRLVCTDTGTLLWLKRGRLVCPTTGPAGTQLQQSGYYNDFALSRDGRLAALLDSEGGLSVWET